METRMPPDYAPPEPEDDPCYHRAASSREKTIGLLLLLVAGVILLRYGAKLDTVCVLQQGWSHWLR